MNSETFKKKFNQLFESNHMGNKPDPTRNEWFTHKNNRNSTFLMKNVQTNDERKISNN